MEPIRILQVVTIMNRGGLETMLMNYYREINREKIQFDFMVHREERGHYDTEIEKLGGRLYQMPQIKPGNYRRYFNLLDQFFKDHNEYQMVHSHINENSSFVLKAANKVGIPGRIAHSHLSDLGIDMKLPFRLYARSQMKDHPTHYFACSEKAGRWLFGSKKIEILNNAVNAEEFSFSEEIRNRVRRQLGIGKDEFVIGHIGRFNKQKNHDFLIDIFNEFQKKKKNSRLLLVGDGVLRSSIEKKINRLGLTSRVILLGVREDIPQLMQAFDYFVFPSLFEGLPVVLIEAQAAGLTCFVSNSITEESNVTGQLHYVSLSDSPEAWANKMLSVPNSHNNNLGKLREQGYDTATNAEWLANFYSSFYMDQDKVVGGNL